MDSHLPTPKLLFLLKSNCVRVSPDNSDKTYPFSFILSSTPTGQISARCKKTACLHTLSLRTQTGYHEGGDFANVTAVLDTRFNSETFFFFFKSKQKERMSVRKDFTWCQRECHRVGVGVEIWRNSEMGYIWGTLPNPNWEPPPLLIPSGCQVGSSSHFLVEP